MCRGASRSRVYKPSSRIYLAVPNVTVIQELLNHALIHKIENLSSWNLFLVNHVRATEKIKIALS